MFWKKKDDPETTNRRALLDYLKNLDRQNLIRWSSDTWAHARELDPVTVYGEFQKLRIELQYKQGGLVHHINHPVFYSHEFVSLQVSLEGNGMIDIDRESAPKAPRGIFRIEGLDPRIDSLMYGAEASLKRAREQAKQSKVQSKIQKAELSAHEILTHLATKRAS